MYRSVNFWNHGTQALSSQRTFLRTISLSERRAHHVNTLALHEFGADDDPTMLLQLLEKAMKMMFNLKNLFIFGSPYIHHAHLESANFSLIHLSLGFPYSEGSVCDEYKLFLAILKAHPELQGISLPDSDFWTTKKDDRFATLEKVDEGKHAAVLCPRLGHIESNGGMLIPSLFVGRQIKHFIADRRRKLGEVEGGWGSPPTFPQYKHLNTLYIRVDSEEPSVSILPTTVARNLTSLTRLHIETGPASWGYRPLMSRYTPDDLILSVARIQTLESLTLSSDGPWCIGPLEQEDMVRFLYKSCPKLREAFVQSGFNSHTHHGVKGMRLGVVGRDVAHRHDSVHTVIFFQC